MVVESNNDSNENSKSFDNRDNNIDDDKKEALINQNFFFYKLCPIIKKNNEVCRLCMKREYDQIDCVVRKQCEDNWVVYLLDNIKNLASELKISKMKNEQNQRITEVLKRYQDLFVYELYKLGCMIVVQYKIYTEKILQSSNDFTQYLELNMNLSARKSRNGKFWLNLNIK
ncbi:34822_t:CDS:1 [Racocetra persica]|uniref:34822_t:CDS:1 n=1 Tax=Racocetra persica TaxID=160502 RepID=A0ACA9NS04_9GLOM|nr:34822_t:CDS:1 [Racocetra persica]